MKRKSEDDYVDIERMLWQHDLDAKKYLVEVHNKEFRKILGEDYKLAKLTDQDREFIMEMVGAGITALEIIPVPETAVEVKEMDFAYINTLSILKFNQQENMIVDRTTGWQQEDRGVQTEEESAFIKKFADKLSGKKKPGRIEGDE